MKMYNERSKEFRKEYYKIWYQDHHSEISEKMKLYYQQNQEKLKEYYKLDQRRRNKEKKEARERAKLFNEIFAHSNDVVF